MADIKSRKILPDHEREMLFSNVETLLAVNQRFLGLLINKRDENLNIQTVGDTFIEILEVKINLLFPILINITF